MAILEQCRQTRRRITPIWLTAVVLFAITSHRPAFAQDAANCGPASTGYCPTPNCQHDDDGMWDKFTGYCSDLNCKFRSWRRKMYFWHHSTHQNLIYPDIPPYYSANYGYFQTCWRPMPEGCERCPEINYSRPGSVAPTPNPQPAMPLQDVPPTQPAGDQPPAPPTPESAPYFPPAEDAKPEPIPPPVQAPPEEFGWKETARPLEKHFKLLPPVEDLVASQEEFVAPLEELIVVSSDEQRITVREPHPSFPILPVEVVLPNDGWEPYEERVPGIIIRARGYWVE